jgi:hypothetical protein
MREQTERRVAELLAPLTAAERRQVAAALDAPKTVFPSPG